MNKKKLLIIVLVILVIGSILFTIFKPKKKVLKLNNVNVVVDVTEHDDTDIISNNDTNNINVKDDEYYELVEQVKIGYDDISDIESDIFNHNNNELVDNSSNNDIISSDSSEVTEWTFGDKISIVDYIQLSYFLLDNNLKDLDSVPIEENLLNNFKEKQVLYDDLITYNYKVIKDGFNDDTLDFFLLLRTNNREYVKVDGHISSDGILDKFDLIIME